MIDYHREAYKRRNHIERYAIVALGKVKINSGFAGGVHPQIQTVHVILVRRVRIGGEHDEGVGASSATPVVSSSKVCRRTGSTSASGRGGGK